ncbi:MAG TPA: hypothetical protein IAB27_05130 [Candidatus Coprosoma intestinipullorum]|uniref:Uncharacterized protein n=1 Tax=Candidatus Coprosoma intestinipullorum TaxID=2840752 RepID=A0A9D0ZR51_9FIRM|nr:hypothetical protein [Candidatus Coprosoma intestinipullorum]
MKVIRFLLGALLVVCLTLAVFVFNISSFSKTENMEKTIENTDLLTEVNKIRNSGKVGNQSSLSSVIDDVYATAEEYGISDKLVDTVIDSKAMKEALGKAAGNVTDYVVNGVETPILTTDDLYKVAEDNIDDWIKESGIEVTDNQKDKILEGSKEFIPIVVDNLPTSSELAADYESEVDAVQTVFSNQVKVILVVVSIILTILLIILGRKNMRWLANLGTSLLVGGLITLGLAFVLPDLITMIPSSSDISFITGSITDYMFRPILISGGVMILLCILLFVFYNVCRKKKA